MLALRIVVDTGEIERDGVLIRPERADALDHPLAASGSNEFTGTNFWLAHIPPRGCGRSVALAE